jgi:imidazolonepropionase-like amidohydrolase
MSTAIKSRRLIFDVDEPAIDDGVVLVDGDRVSAVGTAADVEVPPGAELIDLGGDTLMPGLIDAHGHITMNLGRGRDIAAQSNLDMVEAALQGVANLRQDLASGVTTMRTLGAPGSVEPRFKAAIARGEIDGPRLIIAIRLLRPTHGTASFVSTAVDGPDEIRKCVRETFSLGATWIKMMATNVMQGDTFEDYLRGDMTNVPSFTREETRAIITEAHALGMKVAAHAIGGPGMRWAIEEGVDSIEHADILEAEDVEVFGRHDAYLSDPNLQLFCDSEERILRRPYGRPTESWWRERTDGAAESLRRYLPEIIARGVKVCLAVDSMHGCLWREVGHLAEISGSSQVALRAVTKNCAEMLGMADEIGSIRPGYVADVISVAADPLSDPWALENVRFVMQGGTRVDTRVRKDLPNACT